MPDWDDFLSYDNFMLAWQRILRSRHYYNKDRVGLRVYEANLDANLRYLIDKLREEVYEASPSERIYIAKRTGTVRSIPVLNMEDKLVYQALGNIIAIKSKSIFDAITGGHVFAHLLSSTDDVFMLKRWDGSSGQYRQFLHRYKQLWQRGNQWVVQADIASYYDAIDHELLCQSLRERWLIDGDSLISLLNRCLRHWTNHENMPGFSRGLPQGYETSDYLATLFLLPTDEDMIQKCNYLRYVDDIRILSTDRDSTNRALLELDIALKTQALILQPAKTGARKIDDIDIEIDNLAGELSVLEQNRRRGEDIDEEAEELFFKSWHTLEKDEHAEAHLVFALHRLPPSRPARSVALKMLRAMPWRSDSVTSYLSEFQGNEEVIKVLLEEITTHKVYAAHLANCIRALAKISEPNIYRNICREWIANRQIRWYQRLAAVEALQHDHESYSFLLLNIRQEPNYIVRSSLLVAAAFAASTNNQIVTVIRMGMRDSNPQVVATSVWLYLEFPNCGVDESEFTQDFGVHRRMIPSFSAAAIQGSCFIRNTFVEKFNVIVPDGLDFRTVFSPDYDQAVDHLRRAMRYYNTDPIAFVTSLDNFNQVIAIKVIEILEGRTIPRHEYGNILRALANNYGAISVHFLECHDLRSRSRGPHAWATSLGAWSQDVSHVQKKRLVRNVQVGYQQFVNAFSLHQGIVLP